MTDTNTSTGPRVNTTQLGEQAVRRFMADNPHLPIVGSFYRRPGLHEYADTPAAGAWFVLIYPFLDHAAISAQGPGRLGTDVIGGLADHLPYPRTASGEVDVEALSGDEFQRILAAAVAEKVAVIEAARA